MKTIMNYISVIILGVFGAFFAIGNAHAEVAVIVNPDNDNTFTKQDISQVFFKKTNTFRNGKKVIAINLKAESEVRREFESKVLKRRAKQVNAYWAHYRFTGKGSPPEVIENDAIVKKLVAENPDYIGYIDSKTVDQTVKVVFTAQ